MSESPRKFKTADEYHVEPGVGFVIDGKPLPWYVAEEGPMVEALDPDLPLHIVWVPIIAEGYAPRAGRPDGEHIATRPTDRPDPTSPRGRQHE